MKEGRSTGNQPIYEGGELWHQGSSIPKCFEIPPRGPTEEGRGLQLLSLRAKGGGKKTERGVRLLDQAAKEIVSPEKKLRSHKTSKAKRKRKVELTATILRCADPPGRKRFTGFL